MWKNGKRKAIPGRGGFRFLKKTSKQNAGEKGGGKTGLLLANEKWGGNGEKNKRKRKLNRLKQRCFRTEICELVVSSREGSVERRLKASRMRGDLKFNNRGSSRRLHNFKVRRIQENRTNCGQSQASQEQRVIYPTLGKR